MVEVQGKLSALLEQLATDSAPADDDRRRAAVTDQAIDELAPVVGVAAACRAVGRPRGSHYRHHRQSPPPPKRERVPSGQPRALGEAERKQVLRVLHEPEHVGEAPAAVSAKLLDRAPQPTSVTVAGAGRSQT